MTENKIAQKWLISPRRKLVEVVYGTHIAQVINDVKTFGLTKREIVDTYRRFKEPLYWEGIARNTILLALLKKGWIRCFIRNNYIYFQIYPTARMKFGKNISVMLSHIRKIDPKAFKHMGVRVFSKTDCWIIDEDEAARMEEHNER